MDATWWMGCCKTKTFYYLLGHSEVSIGRHTFYRETDQLHVVDSFLRELKASPYLCGVIDVFDATRRSVE